MNKPTLRIFKALFAKIPKWFLAFILGLILIYVIYYIKMYAINPEAINYNPSHECDPSMSMVNYLKCQYMYDVR